MGEFFCGGAVALDACFRGIEAIKIGRNELQEKRKDTKFNFCGSSSVLMAFRYKAKSKG